MEEKIDVQKNYQQSMNFNTIMNKIEDEQKILNNGTYDSKIDFVKKHILEIIDFILFCYYFEIINHMQYIKLYGRIKEIEKNYYKGENEE